MNGTEQAIKKAIEGGYDVPTEYYTKDGEMIYEYAYIVIDLKFWESLGKQQGWKKELLATYWRNPGGTQKMPTWIMNWHRFIDHLAEGKPIDDFFNHLIK